MGLLDFAKAGVRELAVARPDDKKQLIVWKWPDPTVPHDAQLTVDADEAALFFKDGRVEALLLGGQRYSLSTDNLAFLNRLVDAFTGGNVFLAEVFFVKTQPVRGVPFGGPIGEMIDPLTGEMVCPRMFGEFSVQVTDPARFIVGYAGQAATGSNDEVLDWVKQLFFLGVKTALGEMCEAQGKSLLQAVSLTQELANRFVAHSPSLEDMGMRLLQMGNFSINFGAEDRQRLQEANAEVAKAQRLVKVREAEAKANQFALDQSFSQDARYVQQLAGSYQGYASGKAMMGAGEGMAKGGDASSGAQLAVGLGIAGAMARNIGSFGEPPAPHGVATPAGNVAAPAQVPCSACGGQNSLQAKFCQHCGVAAVHAPLAVAKYCSSCGTKNEDGAKFCSNCGTSLSAG